MNEKTVQEINLIRDILNETVITDDISLVTYNPRVNTAKIREENLSFEKALNPKDKNISTVINSFNQASVAISAAVTSYGRIHISRIKRGILEFNGKIYYSDTDSVVTNLKLADELVDSKEIGKLKLENIVSKAYFISNKLYCLVLDEGTIVIKAKGLNSNSLTLKDFERMYNEPNYTHQGTKTTAIRQYAQAHVIIKDNL